MRDQNFTFALPARGRTHILYELIPHSGHTTREIVASYHVPVIVLIPIIKTPAAKLPCQYRSGGGGGGGEINSMRVFSPVTFFRDASQNSEGGSYVPEGARKSARVRARTNNVLRHARV